MKYKVQCVQSGCEIILNIDDDLSDDALDEVIETVCDEIINGCCQNPDCLIVLVEEE